ncbi:hypothetical protein [Anaerovibrio sp. JC8]|uniref:hypothetical protein n=1 Tax=Anaerovibrio sp. JC8 TaxID=1240085 RepID=UPI000A1176DB|nr:hypothetical protein [Anaerovibrio sp. JC8]
MKIKIGNAQSLTTPDSFKLQTDDRQQIIATDGGNIIQDYGHIASGDRITINATFHKSEFLKVWDYFQTRQLVEFQDPAGITWPDMRVRVLSYGYKSRFENYINCELELWRI